MRLPKAFVPENRNLEWKIKEPAENSKEKESPYEDLELLKTGRTREEKENFLKLFAQHLPGFIEEVREKMGRTGTNRLYLDDEQDWNKGRDWGYRTSLEIQPDGHLYFFHSLSGMTYKADLDNKVLYSYNGYDMLFDYLNTYPDKENIYTFDWGSEDFIDRPFRQGKEMYECIKAFLG